MSSRILLSATVAPGAGAEVFPRLLGLVDVDADPALTLDVDPAAIDLAPLSRSGGVQRARLAFRPGLGVGEVPLSSWSLGADLGAGWRWSIDLPASSGAWVRGPLGWEVDWHGPPLLGAAPTFAAVLGSTAYEIPLLDAATVAGSRRGIGSDGHRLALDGVGAEGVYDLVEVGFRAPADHGLSPAAIIRAVAAEAGIPTTRVEVPEFGPALRRPVEITGAGWLSQMRDLAAAFGYVLDFDRAGRLVAMPWPPPTTDPEVELALEHVTAGGVTANADASVPTCVRVTATAPELPEAGAAESTSPPEVVETYRDFAPPLAPWSQAGDGSLVATGAAPGVARRMLVSRVTTVRRKHGSCQLAEEVVTEGWFAPKAARYTRAADGSLDPIAGVYLFDAAATEGGQQEASLWPEQRFVEISRELRTWHYQATGDRYRLGMIERKGGWSNPPAATKEASPGDPWESTPWLEGIYVEGSGRSVVLSADAYFAGPLPATASGGDVGLNPTTRVLNKWLSGSTALDTEFDGLLAGDLAGEYSFLNAATEPLDGYLRRQLETTIGYRVLPGSTYLYDGGATGATASYEGGVVESVAKSYVPDGGSSHLIVSVLSGSRGEFIEAVTSRGEGYLPAREKCDSEGDAARTARAIEVTLCAAVAPGTPRIVTEISSEWIETDDQARALAAYELRRLRAFSIDLELPFWPTARVAMPISLHLPFFGFHHRPCWLESFEHSASAGGAARTRLTLKSDP